LTKLGKKLTIFKRTVSTREGKKEMLYASDVLAAIKPAINEINRLMEKPDIVKKAALEELFTVTYSIEGEKQNRVITFRKHPVESAEGEPGIEELSEMLPAEQPEEQLDDLSDMDDLETPSPSPPDLKEKPEQDQNVSELQSLLNLLRQRTGKLEKVVAEYHREKGAEYVKWNILYANKKAQKSYSMYLQQALAQNWAEEWAEEERQRMVAEAKRKEEERLKLEAEREEYLARMQAEKEKPALLEAIAKLDGEIKKKFWQEADAKTPKELPYNRPSIVKMNYYHLLCEHLTAQGKTFCQALLEDFRVAFELENPWQESKEKLAYEQAFKKLVDKVSLPD
jgi:hypothetical protein